MAFNFLHLLGGGQPAPANPGAQTPPTLQIPPPGGNAQPPAPDPAAVAAAAQQQAAIDQAVTAAVTTARAEATAAERQRCGEILSAPEAAGRIVMACRLAFETDMPAQAAIGAMRVMPAPAPPGNPLALQQQNAAPQPNVGPAADPGKGDDDAAASAAIINTMKAFGMHPAGQTKEG